MQNRSTVVLWKAPLVCTTITTSVTYSEIIRLEIPQLIFLEIPVSKNAVHISSALMSFSVLVKERCGAIMAKATANKDQRLV